MWLGGNDGLWRLDGLVYTQVSENFTGYLYEDRAGKVWTGSSQGMRDWSLAYYPPGVDSPELVKTQEGQVFGITQENGGNIWFGTERGACQYDGSTIACK